MDTIRAFNARYFASLTNRAIVHVEYPNVWILSIIIYIVETNFSSTQMT